MTSSTPATTAKVGHGFLVMYDPFFPVAFPLNGRRKVFFSLKTGRSFDSVGRHFYALFFK